MPLTRVKIGNEKVKATPVGGKLRGIAEEVEVLPKETKFSLMCWFLLLLENPSCCLLQGGMN